ncbi:hypothetical protein ELQ39_15860 [Streptomyces sp. GB4-14]|uniref:hypothetical protein n=1 Tax=Streptomyces sp. GB4-14 TaxID=2498703 RepID=UPI001F5E674D|nr:hypothetical protein [Streptomyces sp. GB4-14]
MTTNQMPLPSGEDEIITQAQAYEMAGITRAVLRGCIDRGELRIADHKGSRGSARLYRSDVLRVADEKGWPGATGAVVPAQPVSGGGCAECVRLREGRRRDADTIGRLQDALIAATRQR